mmetsp:Transcript_24271/g.52370  ORF Transcript_24271/g.52370 Transcript_24271/m.52370 type:complete len:253 (+) Transcript_24271:69-827(+)
MEEEVDELVAELEASMDHDDLQVPMEHLDEPNNSGATASAGGNSASTFISLLPPELLAKVLQFVPHPVLLTTLRLVGKHISDAAEAEAATRTQLKLQESLTAGFSADARLLPADIVALTWRVQHALHHPSHRRHFRSKYRAILFNLKDPKNPDLRHRLALGELQPEELLHLRTRELAGDALQQQRSAWRQKRTREQTRPDRDCGGFVTNLFRCERCGRNECKVHRAVRAGRMAVDRARTYATCTHCKERWEV